MDSQWNIVIIDRPPCRQFYFWIYKQGIIKLNFRRPNIRKKNPENYTISFYSCECQTLASKSATAENKLFEAERRVEALATLQSHRWMEFSKMADNMKELSHSMLTQSKSNTRKAAIRADLDEELEMWC